MYVTVERTEYLSDSGTTYPDIPSYFLFEGRLRITSEIYDSNLKELKFGDDKDVYRASSYSELSDKLFYQVFNNAFIIYNREDQPEMREMCQFFHGYLPTSKGIFYYDEKVNVWKSKPDVCSLVSTIKQMKGLKDENRMRK